MTNKRKKELEQTQKFDVETPEGKFHVLVFKDPLVYQEYANIIHKIVGQEIVKSYGSVTYVWNDAPILSLPQDCGDGTVVHEVTHIAQHLKVFERHPGVCEDPAEWMDKTCGIVKGCVEKSRKRWRKK